jgi:hypothetical protein
VLGAANGGCRATASGISAHSPASNRPTPDW